LRSVTFLSGLMAAGVSACVLSGGAAATTEGAQPPQSLTQTVGSDVAVGAPDTAFDTFLDRLMRAESNGLSHAKNPRSSALGPFQFITSTFLAVMRQHFPGDIDRLSERQILALRTKHEVARRAAKAFSKDNMAYLMERGVTPTFGHLRLAFLLGPKGAARVLTAPPGKPVAHVLESGVIAANPFMRRMTVADLVARATRDVSPKPGKQPAPPIVPESAPPAPTIVAESAPPAPSADAAATAPEQPVHVADAEVAAPEAQAEPKVAAEPQPAADAKSTGTKTAGTKASETKASETKTAETKTAEAKAAPTPPGRIAARRLDRPAVINVTCDERLASCRRWIDREVAKLIQVAGN
jgi:hypothetical protein